MLLKLYLKFENKKNFQNDNCYQLYTLINYILFQFKFFFHYYLLKKPAIVDVTVEYIPALNVLKLFSITAIFCFIGLDIYLW